MDNSREDEDIDHDVVTINPDITINTINDQSALVVTTGATQEASNDQKSKVFGTRRYYDCENKGLQED